MLTSYPSAAILILVGLLFSGSLITLGNALVIPEIDDGRPFVQGFLSEHARTFTDFHAQLQQDQIYAPNPLVQLFSSYSYNDQFVKYEFIWNDKYLQTSNVVEGEMMVYYYQSPSSSGTLVAYFEGFQPIANRSLCQKSNPFRPSDYNAPPDLARDTRNWLLTNYGPVRSSNGVNIGCDWIPAVVFLAKGGEGAMMETKLTNKENTSDYEVDAYLAEEVGLPIRWQINANLYGAILGLPFDLRLADVHFFESGVDYFETLLFNPAIFSALNDAATGSKRADTINFEVLSDLLADVIANPQVYLDQFPEYQAGIELLLANA